MAEQEGVTVKKNENFSEWYTQVIQKSELADTRYDVKGFLVHMPWSVKTMKLMNNFLEKELESHGHEPVWFPSVIPESFLKKEREHAEFSAEVFWITEGGSNYEKLEERLALRPTSETAMYNIFSLWIRSWRDLPLKTYQNCQVWRYESYTRPFIRGREFYWIEGHDVFATREGAEKQVEEDWKITEDILLNKCAIPFLFFKRPQHDKFKGAENTFAADALMPDGKAIQLPSTHFLGQNFSKAFNVKFVDKNKEEKYGWTTCYGPAVWRILGALVAIHGDDKGLILPPLIAPYQAVIVPIYYEDGDKERIFKKADEILKDLGKKIRATVDKRERVTPGWKYNYWELKGVPLRVEIGPDDIKEKQVVLVRRDTKEKLTVKEGNLARTVKKLLDDIQKDMTKKSSKELKNHISEAKDFTNLQKILEEKGGFVRINWCGSVECADAMKEKTNGGTIRGSLFNKKEKVSNKCIYCGKNSKEVVYFAKSY